MLKRRALQSQQNKLIAANPESGGQWAEICRIEAEIAALNTARAVMLYFKLNADAMNYTPRSHRGQRAARLMPLIRAKYLQHTHH